ncbi:hypothetical protein [Occultella gossypii]|uniref:Uncharacterized protein n=1 Tax=Occultella gossypii TaxID=2800820 RepID=A0ABS7S7Z0_9MICO|nr:hypothetical protein [Occultella gossypii]MBZ2196473.1 hypothetical protein [Occultella gossypii]
MSITTLHQELSDPRQFAKRVKISRGSTAFGTMCLVLGGLLALWNLRSTLRTLDNDLSTIGSPLFWRVFWSTNGEGQAVSYWLYLVVYGPVVLVTLGLLVLGYALISRQAAQRKLYDAFRRRGYVAIGTPIGLSVRADRKSPPRPVQILTHPSLSVQANADLAQAIQRQVVQAGPQVTEWEKAARRAGVVGGLVPLSQIFPGTPQGPMLGTGTELSDGAVVIDSAKPGGKPTSYLLR